MSFRVAARTILQLGAELISSDSIAFYELVKNSFDAGSRRVDLEFHIHIPGANWEICEAALNQGAAVSSDSRLVLENVRDTLSENIDTDIPSAAKILSDIKQAGDIHELREVFNRANRVVIRDSGSGMSLQMFDEVYLTIGTPFRRREREENSSDNHSPFTLGDKGLGRLSVMRIGAQMRVLSTQENELNWHELSIDWDRFSHDSDDLIGDVAVSPIEGPIKEDPTEKGTEITIWGLRHGWTRLELEQMVRDEFSRLMDPFATARPLGIDVTFNGSQIPLSRLDQLLFEAAHATLHATFTVGSGNGNSEPPNLTGEIDYRIIDGSKFKTFHLDALALASAGKTTIQTLQALGGFRLELYWFNRRVLSAVEGIGDRAHVRSLLDRWGGGVAVYRSGFRVNPYGGTDDDWLDLDKDAFRAPGYKLNRQQVIAKVDITSRENPYLLDQTNREGLQQNAPFLALRSLTKHLLEERLRTFLDEVDTQERLGQIEPIARLEARTKSKSQEIRTALQKLRALAPEIVAETNIVDSVQELLKEIQETFRQARTRLRAHAEERERLVLLAGTGLLVDLVAHELNRATSNALDTVVAAENDPNLAPAKTVLTSLAAQLRTLRTRLTVLDDMSVSGRQRKTTFDLVGWVEDILKNHQPQFDRHHVEWDLSVDSIEGTDRLSVTMVRGMVVQVLENLISNSVYWLSLQVREDSTFKPRIGVRINIDERSLTFTDNGPGIELERSEEIFLPFVTTKPPGEGRGLGLYIAKEIVRYHKASLKLSREHLVHPDRLNTFVLSLGKDA